MPSIVQGTIIVYKLVDLSLCFEEYAILYAIVVLFWLLATLDLVCLTYSWQQSKTKNSTSSCSVLHKTKLVSRAKIQNNVLPMHCL